MLKIYIQYDTSPSKKIVPPHLTPLVELVVHCGPLKQTNFESAIAPQCLHWGIN